MVLKGQPSKTVKDADRSSSLLLIHLTKKAASLRHQVLVTVACYKSLEQGGRVAIHANLK